MPRALALTRATEALYVALAAPAPREIAGCPCCSHGKTLCTLVTKPLRSLTADDVGPYLSSVFYTVGGEADFKYLLPRLLEVSLTGWPDLAIVIGKLSLAGWRGWPKGEQAAVEVVIEAMFETVMAEARVHDDAYPDSRIEEVLCGAAWAGLDIAPMLARLREPANAVARRAFVLEATHRRSRSGVLHLMGFWDNAPEPAQRQVLTFLAEENGHSAR